MDQKRVKRIHENLDEHYPVRKTRSDTREYFMKYLLSTDNYVSTKLANEQYKVGDRLYIKELGFLYAEVDPLTRYSYGLVKPYIRAIPCRYCPSLGDTFKRSGSIPSQIKCSCSRRSAQKPKLSSPFMMALWHTEPAIWGLVMEHMDWTYWFVKNVATCDDYQLMVFLREPYWHVDHRIWVDSEEEWRSPVMSPEIIEID